MTQAITTEGDHTKPTPWTGVRFQPSVALGLLVYAGYLAIFYTTWAVNDVDYETIGDTVESTKLHYAMPTLLGCAFLLVAITVLGWWRITLFDTFRSGPKWAWIGPIAMFLFACASFAGVTWGNASSSLLVWSVLGAIGVGFGEEMITRGALLVGLRTNHNEVMAWLFSTIAFAALHAPNALFGQSVGKTAGQLVLTFIVGSLLWSIRRLSGTLILCMFLHGFWDSAAFLPGATGDDPFPGSVLIYLIAIPCVIAVLRKNRGIFVR
jgi:membrane protease YdiL (CAAX protease family)